MQSRDRAGIREPHKRLKEDDSRSLPAKGNFAVTKAIFIKIHLSTIAGVWWLELLFINFIKEITVLNKINNEMVLVLNIYPHHYTTTKGNDKMIKLIWCDALNALTAVIFIFLVRCTKNGRGHQNDRKWHRLSPLDCALISKPPRIGPNPPGFGSTISVGTRFSQKVAAMVNFLSEPPSTTPRRLRE